ncbi:MAG: translin family protein [Candidatus Hydrothermarchaeaceae archaeon]
MNINDIINSIKEELELKDKRREEVFVEAREIRRLSTKAIREIHKEDYDVAEEIIAGLKKRVKNLNSMDLTFSFLQEALQEYSEAALTYRFLKKKELPSPSELAVPPEAYALGLADSLGEIRRYILDTIRRGNFDDVEYFLDLMDELYHHIVAFDYPSAIIPIKRKQDIARAVLEKTRGDVTMALRQAELEKKLKKV